jgi:hypothetical protein
MAAVARHRVEVVAQECWLVMLNVMFCERRENYLCGIHLPKV